MNGTISMDDEGLAWDLMHPPGNINKAGSRWLVTEDGRRWMCMLVSNATRLDDVTEHKKITVIVETIKK